VARVYKPAGDKVVTVTFRPGIADDEYTEVLGGRLNPGDEIVIDASGGAFQQSQSGQRGGGGPMRGNNRGGRGPRFF
jgi:hypothetical protein